MSMVVGVMTLELEIPGAMSLKDKRQVLSKLRDRVHSKFNVSLAEIEANDVWNLAVVGVAIVSNQQVHANQVLSKVLDLVEEIHDCDVADVSMEFLRTS